MKKKIRKGLIVIMVLIMLLIMGAAGAELLLAQFKEFIAFIICLFFLASVGAANL